MHPSFYLLLIISAELSRGVELPQTPGVCQVREGHHPKGDRAGGSKGREAANTSPSDTLEASPADFGRTHLFLSSWLHVLGRMSQSRRL